MSACPYAVRDIRFGTKYVLQNSALLVDLYLNVRVCCSKVSQISELKSNLSKLKLLFQGKSHINTRLWDILPVREIICLVLI